jgi:hypothetical protein
MFSVAWHQKCNELLLKLLKNHKTCDFGVVASSYMKVSASCGTKANHKLYNTKTRSSRNIWTLKSPAIQYITYERNFFIGQSLQKVVALSTYILPKGIVSFQFLQRFSLFYTSSPKTLGPKTVTFFKPFLLAQKLCQQFPHCAVGTWKNTTRETFLHTSAEKSRWCVGPGMGLLRP